MGAKPGTLWEEENGTALPPTEVAGRLNQTPMIANPSTVQKEMVSLLRREPGAKMMMDLCLQSLKVLTQESMVL